MALRFVVSSTLFAVILASPLTTTCKTVSADKLGHLNIHSGSARSSATVSWGCFEDGIVEGSTGWGKLVVNTSSAFNDTQQAFAAGMLEGALTSTRIEQRYASWYNATFAAESADYMRTIMKYVTAQEQWLRQQAQANMVQSDYWSQAFCVLRMLEGVVAGMKTNGATLGSKDDGPKNAGAEYDNTYSKMMLMNWDYDLLEIEGHLFPNGTSSRSSSSASSNDNVDTDSQSYPRSGHCRAVIKLGADLKEVYMAHTTWDSYAMMLPVHKWYNLELQRGTKAVSWALSSYPGTLYSQQDFCIMSSGMVAITTTLPVLDNSVLANLTPESVPGFIRFTIAMRTTDSGADFVKTMARYNSGSFTNQWMIVDLKRLRGDSDVGGVGGGVDPGFLTIAEQLPTHFHSEDMTRLLLQGYWPSYNRPYFDDVSKGLGYPAAVAKSGQFWDYQRYCGASIFRRDAGEIESASDLKRFIRYNDYEHDEFCLTTCAVDGRPVGACGIASRDDLNPGNVSEKEKWQPAALWKRFAGGAIDAKVTTGTLARSLSSMGIAGPTTNSNIPVFHWGGGGPGGDGGGDFAHIKHDGQVERFDFDWELMEMDTVMDKSGVDTT